MKNTVDPKLEVARIIRQNINSREMSVTEAAKSLGVSRPTLSKLLNGRAALSPKMAMRIQETFGESMEKLLTIQASAVSKSENLDHPIVPVVRNVPAFPTIKARDIERWGITKIDARHLLPVLVRRLIHETGRELQKLDFPGYDNAQRHGFDGQVLAGVETLNVPAGQSVWELSVEGDPKRKAESDYTARVNSLSPTDRAETTFVFVTPHNWRKKDEWVKDKNSLDKWKEVRAYDASDLEQWLETTFALRVWLAERLGISTRGIRSLEACWNEWAAASDPQMTPAIFAPSICNYKKKILDWLGASPDRPFTIAADSRLESTAFIACLLREEDVLASISGSALVFESVDALESLAKLTDPIIAIVRNEEVEHRIADAFRRHYCIVVRPRNTSGEQPDIVIDPLGRESFEKALSDMGLERHHFDVLAKKSGLSPTVLRRRLSKVPGIKTPPWAKDPVTAQKLIPMALVGMWDTGLDADQKILAHLAASSFNDVERAVAELHQIEDSPIWCIGKYRGVTSKIDAIFAINLLITEEDLTKFITMAKNVLSKSNPATELLENEEGSPDIFRSMGDPSDMLRNGIRDTLVFLSIYGKDLFLSRLGINMKDRVSALVKHLLTSPSGEILKSYNHDLPDFADTAPGVFLDILQGDLQQTNLSLRSLLQPIGSNIFSSPPRTGILWALERLAWHKEYLEVVVDILAELSRTRIDDNWVNTPIRSLAAIFHSWLPQTAVSVKDRIDRLKWLCNHHSDIGWQICVRQINSSNRIGEYSARSRWHAIGSMTPVSRSERLEFERTALDMIINWPSHSVKTIGDLLPCLPWMNEEDQIQVLDCAKKWALAESNENATSEIREKIGDILFTIAGPPPWLRAKALAQARVILKKLIPNDPFERYALLFRDLKSYFPIANAEDPNLTRADWRRQIYTVRKEAIAEIWSSKGINGVLILLSKNTTGGTLGRASSQVLHPQQAVEAIRTCLSTEVVSNEKIDGFLQGFFETLDDNVCAEVLSSLLNNGAEEDVVRVLRFVPFRVQIWQLLDQMSEHIRDQWWRKAAIPLEEYSAAEAGILVDNLLRVGREWDAFSALRANYDKVRTCHLKRLLQGITEKHHDLTYFPSGETSYYMSKAIDSLGKRSGVSVDEMAQLEFALIGWLDPIECRIPYLEKQFAESPSVFVDYLLLFTKCGTGDRVLKEWHVEDENQQQILKLRAFKLFQALDRLPGQNDQGEISPDVLIRWIFEVRDLASVHGCIELCDEQLGQWLSRTPAKRKDVQWPSQAVCEILESIRTDEIALGFRMGVLNARGTTVRSPYEGGGQERNLVDKYRHWAKACGVEFSFVSKILNDIAERYESEATWEDQQAGVRRYRDL